MEIRILGPGCPNCERLARNLVDALAELDLEADVQKVEKLEQIMRYGVMATPALAIDGKVVVKGRVPSSDELKRLLSS